MRQYTRYLKKIRLIVVPQRSEQTGNVLVTILTHKLKRLPVRQAVFILVSSRGSGSCSLAHNRVVLARLEAIFFFTFVRLFV